MSVFAGKGWIMRMNVERCREYERRTMHVRIHQCRYVFFLLSVFVGCHVSYFSSLICFFNLAHFCALFWLPLALTQCDFHTVLGM